ncbi:hypothetical protein T484DRAFT_1799219 [Baffinella frigidus]|nr:hypothetical protein T484DRAFT_1799219 [Cryptophyta sp. CCMP2293]
MLTALVHAAKQSGVREPGFPKNLATVLHTTTLSLNGVNLSYGLGFAIAECLRHNKKLTRVSLAHTRLSHEALQAVLYALAINSNVLYALAINSNVTYLDLSSNPLFCSGTLYGPASGTISGTISRTGKEGGDVGGEGAEALSVFLQCNAGVEELRLQDMGLTDIAGTAIAARIAQSDYSQSGGAKASSLRIIDVSGNLLTDVSAARLAVAVVASRQELGKRLSAKPSGRHNTPDDPVKLFPYLTVLNLENNMLTRAGCARLQAAAVTAQEVLPKKLAVEVLPKKLAVVLDRQREPPNDKQGVARGPSDGKGKKGRGAAKKGEHPGHHPHCEPPAPTGVLATVDDVVSAISAEGLTDRERVKMMTTFCASLPHGRHLALDDAWTLVTSVIRTKEGASAIEALYCSLDNLQDKEEFSRRMEAHAAQFTPRGDIIRGKSAAVRSTSH